MYKIIHAIDIKTLQKRVNEKLHDGYVPIGSVSIRNIGKSFKDNDGEIMTEIEYYQPIWKPKEGEETKIFIFNKSCILNFK